MAVAGIFQQLGATNSSLRTELLIGAERPRPQPQSSLLAIPKHHFFLHSFPPQSLHTHINPPQTERNLSPLWELPGQMSTDGSVRALQFGDTSWNLSWPCSSCSGEVEELQVPPEPFADPSSHRGGDG